MYGNPRITEALWQGGSAVERIGIVRLQMGWDKMRRILPPGDRDSKLRSVKVVGFGFVFLHPFEDGNGRLHRYLIHHVLSARQFTPPFDSGFVIA